MRRTHAPDDRLRASWVIGSGAVAAHKLRPWHGRHHHGEQVCAPPRTPPVTQRASGCIPAFYAHFLQDSCNAYTLAVQAASFGASAFILYPSLELQPLESIDWLPPINPSRLALPVCVISASQAQTPTSLKPRTHTHAAVALHGFGRSFPLCVSPALPLPAFVCASCECDSPACLQFLKARSVARMQSPTLLAAHGS